MCDRGFHGSISSSSTLGARGLYLSKGGMDPRYDAAEKRKPLYRLGASAARFAFVAELTALLHESPQLRLRHLYIDNNSAQDLPFA
jgi:hypothetical protein